MKLSDWIGVSDVSKLQKQFSKNLPFKHIVLRNFLHQNKAELLLAALKKEPFEHKESDLFSLNQTKDFSGSKNKTLAEFYQLAASPEFADFMKSLTGLDVKPGALDLAGSLYSSGDYLLCHDDQVEDRKIAYILYLSKDFVKKDGARFVLFNNKKGEPGEEAAHFSPEWNSLMLFEVSPISFHSVEENMSEKDRYAIGGWLH